MFCGLALLGMEVLWLSYSRLLFGEGGGCSLNLSHGMADLVSYGNANRDTEQALIALKKGSQLLKYGRKGKPKFCPFRLSNNCCVPEGSMLIIGTSPLPVGL
ncbi:Pleckstrin-like proteiny-like domain-containing protein [Cucumis melo var. makuwa]|uniref:Pleckstrin-like proteiny-like domain-containing protein n=1 Tax=Cucumis melo var. makuwa TaxID=1194695 RepID=A0A5D3E892_CUCMM|nr:Pleckstrin-like proteiny-like domain-containing protein [Cucumis melo var. makuwa]